MREIVRIDFLEIEMKSSFGNTRQVEQTLIKCASSCTLR
jgi:hypothetical protein